MNTNNNQPATAVLLYHRMGWPKLGSLVAGQYVVPGLFKSQLNYLTTQEWSATLLADAVAQCKSGKPETRNQYCVTFDDGYLSVYEHACPALVDCGARATIYVVASCVGGINDWDRKAGDQEERMMTAAQVRELADNGFEIGSHTLTHPRLTEIDDDQLQRELIDSKHRLEDIIGKPVESFSYPYGDYDGRVLQAAIAAGYTNAVGTRLGVMVSSTALFEIPRINVRWNAIAPLLERKITRAMKASGFNR